MFLLQYSFKNFKNRKHAISITRVHNLNIVHSKTFSYCLLHTAEKTFQNKQKMSTLANFRMLQTEISRIPLNFIYPKIISF
jgi:hypothetical protein